MKTSLRITAALGIALILTSCSSPSPTPVTGEPATSTQGTPAEEVAKAVEPLPFNASGLLGGNTTPSFGDGDPGEVSVVQIGARLVDQKVLLFAFRNNTDEAIAHVDWTATARSGGSIVGSGRSQGTAPSVVQSGEVALSYIYFDNLEAIPDDAEYEFSASSLPANTSSYNTAALKVTEANLVGDSIVGGAVNETGADATGPFSVSIYCFDGGQMADHKMGFADQQDAADGATVSFSENLYSTSCPNFVVGVSGYFK
ncbi:MAG: hypothetical protein GX440_04135 [Propionibacterium sp.]|nr:hypothetical protein [Propionibacterium sp.]